LDPPALSAGDLVRDPSVPADLSPAPFPASPLVPTISRTSSTEGILTVTLPVIFRASIRSREEGDLAPLAPVLLELASEPPLSPDPRVLDSADPALTDNLARDSVDLDLLVLKAVSSARVVRANLARDLTPDPREDKAPRADLKVDRASSARALREDKANLARDLTLALREDKANLDRAPTADLRAASSARDLKVVLKVDRASLVRALREDRANLVKGLTADLRVANSDKDLKVASLARVPRLVRVNSDRDPTLDLREDRPLKTASRWVLRAPISAKAPLPPAVPTLLDRATSPSLEPPTQDSVPSSSLASPPLSRLAPPPPAVPRAADNF